MNLTTDPWLPVRMSDGSPRLLSLNELFTQSATIDDLSLAPHERISVMRLLICITQAAIGFPEDEESWAGFGDDLETEVVGYLKKWNDSFELFGEGERFLQAPSEIPIMLGKNGTSKEQPYEKIIFEIATGNNVTISNHRLFIPTNAKLALNLLIFQNFFDGSFMGTSGKGKGVCDSGLLHTFLRGQNLREIILNNCIDQVTCENAQDTGRPYWENPYWQLPKNKKNVPDWVSDEFERNCTLSYLGRLVPIPCSIWLDGTLEEARIRKGVTYPKFEESPPESSITLLANAKKNNLFPLRVDPNKSIWRELHSLTVLKKLDDTIHAEGPRILRSHSFDPKLTNGMSIWCGALSLNQAKIEFATESTTHLPLSLFSETGRGNYDEGIKYAEYRAKNKKSSLTEAAKTYGKALKVDKPNTNFALRHYWHSLDQQSQKLLEVVQQPELLDKVKFGPSSDPWSKAVYQAAIRAYETACPRNTPRQIQAYAAGLNKLFPRKKKAAVKKSTKPTTAQQDLPL